GQDDQQQAVVALDAETGTPRWKTAVAPFYENAMGNGPRATPAVHGELVFAYTGEGILAALHQQTGAVRWSVAVPQLLGGDATEYGNASSPLIVGDLVIVQANGRQGRIAAFQTADGSLAWKAGGAGTSGYSSPVLTTLSGTQQVIAFTGNAAMGIQPADGTVLWQISYETDYDCNTACPVQLNEDTLLISSGENHGSTILSVRKDGSRWTATPQWESLGRNSVLRAEWQTPVLLNGYLYALDNVGSAGPITNLVCVRVADGRQMWIKPRFGKANLIAADGHLYLSTMAGELIVVKADPKAFQETGRSKLIETTRQAPVIANGRLYLRDTDRVVCVDLRN
ncbi:MAG: PQQ-like beta-propeller repeat protein, partial [Planctomycetaceae bacterium]|nr:PQQ-like beta-propeller repeat protein [Planctomycetaceae bacterium]